MKKSEDETRKEVNVGTCPRCGSKIPGEASACKSCLESSGSVTTSLEEKPVPPAQAGTAAETATVRERPEAAPKGAAREASLEEPAVPATPEKPMASVPEPAAPPLAEEMVARAPEEAETQAVEEPIAGMPLAAVDAPARETHAPAAGSPAIRKTAAAAESSVEEERGAAALTATATKPAPSPALHAPFALEAASVFNEDYGEPKAGPGYTPAINKARTALFFVTVLNLLYAAGSLVMLLQGPDSPVGSPPMVWLVLLSILFAPSAVFFVLWGWANRKPLAASLLGLGLYGGLIALQVQTTAAPLVRPQSLMHLAVLLTLLYAAKSAWTYRKLLAAMA